MQHSIYTLLNVNTQQESCLNSEFRFYTNRLVKSPAPFQKNQIELS
uniref:Uncharacterized protein n=1 Tax=Anguilla anguilla TaxID=7936 RepID=A0A0E9W9W5_ANGAN